MTAAKGEASGRVRLRIFGHPLHASLVHLPIGVLGSVAVWDALALLREETIWWALSFWSLALGTVAAVPTIATGLLDYADLPEGTPAATVANRHMISAFAAVACYATSLLLRGGPELQAAGEGFVAVGLAYLGLVLLVATGWLGGELILRHGVGQQPTPEAARDIRQEKT